MSGRDADERNHAEGRDAEAFFDRFARVIDGLVPTLLSAEPRLTP